MLLTRQQAVATQIISRGERFLRQADLSCRAGRLLAPARVRGCCPFSSLERKANLCARGLVLDGGLILWAAEEGAGRGIRELIVLGPAEAAASVATRSILPGCSPASPRGTRPALSRGSRNSRRRNGCCSGWGAPFWVPVSLLSSARVTGGSCAGAWSLPCRQRSPRSLRCPLGSPP